MLIGALASWSASAAFYSRGEGHLLTLRDAVEYRPAQAGAAVESVVREASGWTRQSQRPFAAPEGALDYWARFELPADPKARRLLIDSGPWESVEYHFVRDGRVADRQVAGTTAPRMQRRVNVTMTSIVATSDFVAVDLPAGAPTTVYARLKSSQRLTPEPALRFSLWDEDRVLEGERRDRITQGIFFGIVLVLVVYNVGLFFLDQREPSYLYYAAAMLFAGLVVAAFFGLSAEYVWPRRPWWDYYALWISIPAGLAALVQFIRQHLATWSSDPRADRILKAALYVCLGLIPVILVPMAAERPMSAYTTLQLLVAVATLAVVALVAVTLRALARRHPAAPLLTAAFACGAGGLLVSLMALMGLLPLLDPVLHAGQIGAAAMGILLSLGIGLRLRAARLEHERSLEGKVAQRTAELTIAQRKADGLLGNILPQAIIAELKDKGASEPRRHEEASILFTDFHGFTETVGTIPPRRLVQELDEIFRAFDDIVAANGLEKIKTIGDAYMAAAGLPLEAPDHARRCVRAALQLAQYIRDRNQSAAFKWGLRVGVHSGTVVAGIVGKAKYAYDVWGDTVNVAARLESAGEVGKVNVSAYTYELVRDAFDCEYRGKLQAKGKGEIDMYFVRAERAAPAQAQAAATT